MLKIAHRSGPVTYPEQTIQSAREAIALGADIVEIDVRLTFDGQLAVTHDENVLRVFGVDALVGTLTAEQFCSLRHASDPAFCSHMFEDFLAAGVAPLLVHVKVGSDPMVIERLLESIAKFDYAEKIILGLTRPDHIARIHEADPRIRILSFGDVKAIDKFLAAGVDFIRLWEEWLTPELVDKIKSSGVNLAVMSGLIDDGSVGVPTDEGLQRILSYHPDSILINDVRRIK